MLVLARLLLCQRWRRLNLHFGWAGYVSAGLMLCLFGWAASVSAARYARQVGAGRSEILLIALWTAWAVSAAITGKDLSWRISLERILAFPYPGFLKLYALAFFLGFLSAPLLVCLFVVLFWAFALAGLNPARFIAVLTGYGLFVASVRAGSSLLRAVLRQGRLLPGSHVTAVVLASISITACALASMSHSGFGALHPGRLFSLVLSGRQVFHALSCLSIWTALFVLTDFKVQQHLTFSGIRGPFAPGVLKACLRSVFMLHPAWPGPLFRIGVCGWLRSRSALLLFVWGATYSFLWTYFSGPQDEYYFYLFIWMNLLFHAYLRGNLLGTDRSGAWIYYMFASHIDRALSAKSLSLTLLQGSMVASLLAAGLLQVNPSIGIAAWSRIASYAVSGILFGEICGFFFSILYPDSIDRTSQFDGGTTVGALMVPVLQIVFLFVFMFASGGMKRPGGSAACWAALPAVPLLLFMVRFAVLKNWARRAMLENRESILKKLSGRSL
jgi:hypothetical protein